MSKSHRAFALIFLMIFIASASIPIALDEALKTQRIRNGDYILLEAFGGGFTWGSALIKW